MSKRNFQIIVVLVLVVTSFASAGNARAWGNCPSYITVQWGDTLGGIALLCGTTVDAIRAANPGLGWWLYAGQVLYIPTGYTPPPAPTYGTYLVQWGDTLGKIAARTGVSWRDIWAVNPQIKDPSLIYAGQVINLPSGVSAPSPVPVYPPYQVPAADSYSTLKITYKYGLYIRNAPGGGDIVSSAVYKTYWKYNTGTIRRFKDGSVWVEVKMGERINGSWTGWILVRDNLYKYFTDPQID